ncbi:hypothetical protein [Desulfoscipio gibsoniae]|uniref:Uncharacterized protein n=1 Tax=Desulfoscipio gibsoniae DSM 7213 TaxID=767817 RepID=R4KPG0_9FIRM|nr:hypothetical protein [Desulfoscipio gibsoniae]AGL01516.1 hypothetical protein Desgi_2082 [Desulfoscipio gibsoniae DSM 7213]
MDIAEVKPCLTKVIEETKELIKTWGIDENVFDKARIDFERLQTKGTKDNNNNDKVRPPKKVGKKKSNSIKWVCSECGTIIQSTEEVNVICGDCGATFEKEE